MEKSFCNFQVCLLFQVLIFLIFQLKITTVSTAKIGACEVGKDEHGTIVADCRGTGISSIPNNLGANIDILDISDNNNTLTVLGKDDLKYYPKLWGLIMRGLSVTHFPAGFFQHSSLLRMLNISITQIENLVEIPPSIKTLNFSYSNFEHMDFSHLINLEELFVRCSPNMKTVPSMQKTAPLQVIDVKFCPLTEGSYTQIAPFCHLRYFGLYSEELMEANYTYQCCGFRRWLRSHGVKYGWQLQNCSKETDDDYCGTAHFDFDEEAVLVHNECSKATRKKVYTKIIIAFIVLVIMIIVSGFVIYYLYKKKISKTEKVKGSVASSDDEAEAEADQDSND